MAWLEVGQIHLCSLPLIQHPQVSFFSSFFGILKSLQLLSNLEKILGDQGQRRVETQNLYLKICECPMLTLLVGRAWLTWSQQGGGELFFVPDDEDDLQDNVAVGDWGEG